MHFLCISVILMSQLSSQCKVIFVLFSCPTRSICVQILSLLCYCNPLLLRYKLIYSFSHLLLFLIMLFSFLDLLEFWFLSPSLDGFSTDLCLFESFKFNFSQQLHWINFKMIYFYNFQGIKLILGYAVLKF